LTLVTPSQWLADLVKQSFLKAYPVRVIHNGIDLSVFKQITGNFKDKHLIPQGKHIVLGVSLSWSNRKGLDVFIELSRRLDSEKYQIVLVGIGKELAHGLPDNIISIDHTQNQAELAEIYSTSDVFVNPTREDTFPTVNLEALACGTPVVTFQTGGSPECIDPSSGSVVAYDDIDALLAEIIHVCGDKPYSSASCVERASRFDKNQKHQEYMAVYKNLLR